MLVLAHRGHHRAVPENSVAAFAAAAFLGVDGVETDVRITRDGRAVLVHDRVTPGGMPVAALSHLELERALGRPVAHVADALDAFPQLYWNVEIKEPRALAETLRVLAPRVNRVRMLVTSFHHDVVLACAEVLPVECGLLLAHRPVSVEALVSGAATAPRVRCLVWDYNVLEAAAVEDAARAGWTSYAYGMLTAAEHVRCRELGLAGVITDHPETALAVARRVPGE